MEREELVLAGLLVHDEAPAEALGEEGSTLVRTADDHHVARVQADVAAGLVAVAAVPVDGAWLAQ